MKFFPEGIGDSQKAQIRDSFNRIREHTPFRTKSWTLCLPIDMSVEEKKWFDGWKENQRDTGIEIRPVWSAFHLEGLLYMHSVLSLQEVWRVYRSRVGGMAIYKPTDLEGQDTPANLIV